MPAVPPPAPTFRRVRAGSDAAYFSHPCAVCGAPFAPFGRGVDLLKAFALIRAGKKEAGKQFFGVWTCGPEGCAKERAP